MAGFFKKLSGFILPKEIDFFGNLAAQSRVTARVIYLLKEIYFEKGIAAEQLSEAMEEAHQLRTKNLAELNEVLITPVDKEAISRIYLSLDWIVLSIKHLYVELNAYQISSLREHEKIFLILGRQIEKITTCFEKLKMKKYDEVMHEVNEIIKLDDQLIREYSVQLVNLFNNDSVNHILPLREILSQLREISKRMHVAANNIEDIVFKMH